MSRYLAHADADPPSIERLPKGTPLTDGKTFDEAKRELLEEMRGFRDTWIAACKRARRLSRTKLSLADITADAADDDNTEEE